MIVLASFPKFIFLLFTMSQPVFWPLPFKLKAKFEFKATNVTSLNRETTVLWKCWCWHLLTVLLVFYFMFQFLCCISSVLILRFLWKTWLPSSNYQMNNHFRTKNNSYYNMWLYGTICVAVQKCSGHNVDYIVRDTLSPSLKIGIIEHSISLAAYFC